MNRIVTYLICLSSLLIGCASDQIGEDAFDNFFLKSDGSVMPIHVRGNTTSNTFIIYLHGGPGFTAFEAYQESDSPFTMLQRDFAVVYWDQRCAGTSQGNCDYDKLVLSQYTEDLEDLIILLKTRYGENLNLYLIGHSWGGALGVDYLSRATNQDQIKGWIEVGGGHNIPRIVQLEREMVNIIGQRQIALGDFSEDWGRFIEEANSLDFSITEDVFDMNSIASDAESLMRRADSVNRSISTLSLNDYFFGPVDFHALRKNGQNTIDALEDELVQLNLSANTTKITIPTLLIWGEYDFRVPPTFAQEALERYGAEDKELAIIENAAHFVQWQQPGVFYNLVREFVLANP